MSDTTEAVLTVNDLMVRWKSTRKSILEAIKEGRLRAFRVGKRVFRVAMTEVLRYEAAGQERAA